MSCHIMAHPGTHWRSVIGAVIHAAACLIIKLVMARRANDARKSIKQITGDNSPRGAVIRQIIHPARTAGN